MRLVLVLLLLPLPAIAAGEVLRVCADPNNLPFSNAAEEGFENRIAELVADELGWKLEYTWHAQRRGFLRNTLYAGKCDVVMGQPSGREFLEMTRPYYRSTYVFLTRKDSGVDVESLDDPELESLRVGVHLIGDDYQNTPPVHALARRGIIDNVVGYSIYGDYSKPNPPADLVNAVAAGEVDVGIVWGPLAGYFAERQDVPLEMKPVKPMIDANKLPFFYSISMATRDGDHELKAKLDEVLHRERDAIERILADYGVPDMQGRTRTADRRTATR